MTKISEAFHSIRLRNYLTFAIRYVTIYHITKVYVTNKLKNRYNFSLIKLITVLHRENPHLIGFSRFFDFLFDEF